MRQAAPRRARRGAFAAALIALGLAATACGGSSGSASSTNSLTMLAVQDSSSLDPFRASYVSTADGTRMTALYDPLVYLDSATRTVKPHLAEALTTADGGATWMLELRAGVRFSDGTPFDAEAVRLTWETHAKPEARSLHAGYARGLALTVTDPLTLRITPSTPNPNFDMMVANQLAFIVAPSALAKGIDAAGANPVGAGPFKLESWTHGSQQVYVKNEDYWQKDKGLPKVDKVTFKNVPDIKQQFNTVKTGGADLFVSSDQATLARGKAELQAPTQDNIGGQYVQFNLRKPPFDDPRARRAIALALDPADIPKTLDNGYVPAQGYFPRSSPFFDASAAQPVQDKAAAQALFDELAAEGKGVDFTYLIPTNPSSARTAELMQSKLREFRNVTMRIESLEIGAYIVRYAVQKDFQALLTSQNVQDPEPVLYGLFHSKSPTNYSGWSNPRADAALEAGRASTDPGVRKEAYARLQKELSADLPVWVYTESMTGVVAVKNVTGIEMIEDGVVLMDRVGKK